jgi:plastocyanin
MKRSMMALALAMALLLLTGYQGRIAEARQAEQVVTMGATTFGQTSISIKQGQTITFVDEKATGTEHILVIGKEGKAQPESGAPDFQGSKGMTFLPGQSWTSPPWATAGTYHVTCTVHPTTMNLTVIVTP